MRIVKVSIACLVMATAGNVLGDWLEPLTDSPEGKQAKGYGILLATNDVHGATNYVAKIRTDVGARILPLFLPEKKDVSSLVGKLCKITAVIEVDREQWGAEKARRLRVVEIEQYDPKKGRPNTPVEPTPTR